jgi:hypothetical protein
MIDNYECPKGHYTTYVSEEIMGWSKAPKCKICSGELRKIGVQTDLKIIKKDVGNGGKNR